MTIVLIAIAGAAACFARDTAIFVPAIINAILSFWENGVLANYGRGEAPQLGRMNLQSFVPSAVRPISQILERRWYSHRVSSDAE